MRKRQTAEGEFEIVFESDGVVIQVWEFERPEWGVNVYEVACKHKLGYESLRNRQLSDEQFLALGGGACCRCRVGFGIWPTPTSLRTPAITATTAALTSWCAAPS
jgi:hypothetical protein